MERPILSLRHVTVDYKLKQYAIRAVTDISLDIERGSITAFVGESGSGKTTLASSVIGCISSPGELTGGEIHFYRRGQEEPVLLHALDEDDFNKVRWADISMVFQAAQSALNPVMTVADQFVETYLVHRPQAKKADALKKSRELLAYVKLDADRVLDAYPHELSGGMKQRVMIAFSLLLDPQCIILDEPTTALDVITQDYIFRLLRQINRDLGITLLLLTHDMGVVAKFTDYVGVIYAGRLMEFGPTRQVFARHLHPYTECLIRATPTIVGSLKDMRSIPGSPPDLRNLPTGCVFHPRCPYAESGCSQRQPHIDGAGGHRAACLLREKEGSACQEN